MISFLDLIYFETVARLQSFTVAANELYISQQALSASIAKIESYLGTTLLNRTANCLSLTLIGEEVYQLSLDITSELKNLEASITRIPQNTICIFYMPHLVFHEIILYKAKQLFQKQHPEMSIHISTSKNLADIHFSDYSFICFNSHFISAYNGSYMKKMHGFTKIPFYNDRYCLIYNCGTPFVPKVNQTLPFQKLLILNGHKASPEFIFQLKKCGYNFQGVIENKKSLEAILSTLATNTDCMSIVPKIALQRYSTILDEFQIIELPQFLLTQHMIAYNKFRAQSQPYMLEFLRLFLQESKNFNLTIPKSD